MAISLMILTSDPIWWALLAYFSAVKHSLFLLRLFVLYQLDFRHLQWDVTQGWKGNANSHISPMLEKSRKLREQIQYVIGIKL